LTDYKHELGKSESKLNAHQALVTASIEEYIAKGGQRRCHIDWVTAEKTALALVRTMQMNIRKPGWEHQEWNFYMANHDNRIETESGHREFTWQGTRGVLIPDKPITKIEFNEQIAAVMSQDLGSTASLGLVTENDIQHNMHNLASICFTNAAGQDGTPGASFPPVPSFSSLVGLPNAPPALATPPPQPSPAKALVKVVGSCETSNEQTASATGQAPAVEAKAPARRSGVPKGQAKAAAKAKGQAGGGDAASSDALAIRPPAGAGGSVAQGRGRRPKHLQDELTTITRGFELAQDDSPIYFGSEIKVGLKQFADLNKLVQSRMKQTTVEAELVSLRVLLKHTNAIHAVLISIKDHGIRSQQFRDSFDSQQTACKLEPVCDVVWPKHIAWNRHRMLIQSVDQVETWASLSSTAQLIAQGLTESCAQEEQDKLVGEKLANIFKLDPMPIMMKEYSSFFQESRRWAFVEQVNNAVAALTLAHTYSNVSDLDELIDFVGEAVLVLGDEIARKTSIGSALVGWPKGKILFESMQSHEKAALATRSFNERIARAASSLLADIQADAVLGGVDNAADKFTPLIEHIEVLRPRIANVGELILEGKVHCIAKFLSISGDVTEAGFQYYRLVLSCWTALFEHSGPDMFFPKDMKQVTKFVKASAGPRKRLALWDSDDEAFQVVFKDVTTSAADRMAQIYDWYERLAILSEAKYNDPKACTDLRSDIAAITEDTGASGFDVTLEKFRKSPLFDPRGPVVPRLVSGAVQEGRAKTQALWKALEGLIYQFMPSSHWSSDTLEKMMAWEIDQTVWSDALQWATTSGDVILRRQLSCLHSLWALQRATAAVEKLARSLFPKDTPVAYKHKKMCVDHVKLVKELRARIAAFQTTMQTTSGADAFVHNAEIPEGHISIIEEAFAEIAGEEDDRDVTSLEIITLSSSRSLMIAVCRQWEVQATSVADLLEKQIPPAFMASRSSLFSNDDLCMCLLQRTEEYQRIGPFCAEALEFARLIKLLHSDSLGATIPVALQKRLGTLCNDGIEYVCFVYALHYIRREFTTYAKGSEKLLKGCEAVRAKFVKHKVSLTDELDSILKSLEQGSKCPIEFKLVQSSEAAAVPVVRAGGNIGVGGNGGAPEVGAAESSEPQPFSKKRIVLLSDRLRSRQSGESEPAESAKAATAAHPPPAECGEPAAKRPRGLAARMWAASA